MSRGELDTFGRKQVEERIVDRRCGPVHRVEHALVLLRAGHGENVRVALGDRFWLRPHAPGHDDLAVLRQRLTDGPQQLLLGAVEKAAGIDDHQIGAVVLGREFVAFRAQARDDALGIDQCLGAAERDKADLGSARRHGRCLGGHGNGQLDI